MAYGIGLRGCLFCNLWSAEFGRILEVDLCLLRLNMSESARFESVPDLLEWYRIPSDNSSNASKDGRKSSDPRIGKLHCQNLLHTLRGFNFAVKSHHVTK
jgi:hypothetical protein